MDRSVEEIFEDLGPEATIFKLLDPEERRNVSGLFDLRKYKAGAVVFEDSEKIGFMGIIVSGSLKFERKSSLTNNPIILALLGRGSHVGDVPMGEDRDSLGRTSALEDTNMLVVSNDKLDSFMLEHPQTGIKILKGASRVLRIRLKNAIDKIVHLS